MHARAHRLCKELGRLRVLAVLVAVLVRVEGRVRLRSSLSFGSQCVGSLVGCGDLLHQELLLKFEGHLVLILVDRAIRAIFLIFIFDDGIRTALVIKMS